jgi:hypothetical protein
MEKAAMNDPEMIIKDYIIFFVGFVILTLFLYAIIHEFRKPR